MGGNLGFEAEKLDGVRQSIDLLREIALNRKVPGAEKLIVIGGGNVAMDIARSIARLQKQKFGTVDVHALALESREELPCDEEELVESTEEGIIVHPSYGPKEISYKGREVTGADFVRCTSVFDGEGRFFPQFDESDRIHINADMVIESIGQAPDMKYIPADVLEDLEFTPRRKVAVDDYGRTSIPWLFAGGDIVRGPDAINGIADGHRAARGIDAFLSGKKTDTKKRAKK